MKTDRSPDFRRMARWWAVLGVVGLIFLSVMAIAHFGFGEPVYDKASGEPLSDTVIVLGGLIMASGCLLFAGLGFAILRRTKKPKIPAP